MSTVDAVSPIGAVTVRCFTWRLRLTARLRVAATVLRGRTRRPKERIMACEDIEQRLADLRAEKRSVQASLDMLPPHKRPLVQANLDRITADIAREENSLADCLAAAAGSADEDLDTVGYVGTLEVETRGTARLWFSLTEEPDGAAWVKIGAVRAWFTMNLEAADRPFYMAQLPLLMEAMRSDLQVEVSHGGAELGFEKWDPKDSFAVNGVRVLRAPLRF
jgi:hypothetical protein